MLTAAILDFGRHFGKKKMLQKYSHNSSIIPTNFELSNFKTKKIKKVLTPTSYLKCEPVVRTQLHYVMVIDKEDIKLCAINIGSTRINFLTNNTTSAHDVSNNKLRMSECNGDTRYITSVILVVEDLVFNPKRIMGIM